MTSRRYSQAFTLLSKAFLLDPAHTSSFSPIATLCQLSQRWGELEHFCHIRLKTCPNDTEALYHLAGADLSQWRFVEAIELLKKTIAINPHHVNAWIDLGCAWKKFGEIDQALHCFQKAVAEAPDLNIAHDNLLFTMLFSDRYSPEELFAAHRNRWMQHTSSNWSRIKPEFNGRIRVGYLSPDFCDHSVASFLEPLLASHDISRFDIFCYHSHTKEDAVTQRLKSYNNHWHNIAEIDDDAAAELIRSDGINILVELAGHTAWNRLPLLNLRPAPIQVSWLGYPHSTGMLSVDYRITDSMADPLGISDQLYTEKLVRLPRTFICYRPPDGFEPFRTLPYQRNGYITFGSFNNFAKVSPAVIKCWRQILTMVPDSRLLLKSAVFTEETACQIIAQRLDLPLNRLIMIGSTPDRTSHLALYSQVDIALDTFPYNGTTTTCEALYMGVPVVTVLGDHHAARVGASILGTVGVGELVAGSADGYIDKAIELAHDIPRLVWFRQHLPGLMANSPLMDQDRFTAAMEAAYRQMWQHFIDG